MKDHILEFIRPGSKILKNRGHLCVISSDSDYKIPLDDISGALILGEDILISTNAITALIEKGVVLQFSDSRYLPTGLLIPYVGHKLMRTRLLAQQRLSQSQKGRIWQKIVVGKIMNQAACLVKLQKEATLIKKFSKEVRSNDSENHEAQAARAYWNLLFGDDFNRDPYSPGINSFLNYGYSILRSAIARYTVACGLNTAIGLFHRNMENPFCLVDDLMEPFRPIVDFRAHVFKDAFEMTTEIKRSMVSILEGSVLYNNEVKPLRNALQEYCQSFARAVMAGDHKLFNIKFEIMEFQ